LSYTDFTIDPLHSREAPPSIIGRDPPSTEIYTIRDLPASRSDLNLPHLHPCRHFALLPPTTSPSPDTFRKPGEPSGTISPSCVHELGPHYAAPSAGTIPKNTPVSGKVPASVLLTAYSPQSRVRENLGCAICCMWIKLRLPYSSSLML
jgi:hypothetical protein